MTFWLTGNANINPETGIRYGVTNQVPDWLWDESMGWECPAYDEAVKETAIELMRDLIKDGTIPPNEVAEFEGSDTLGGVLPEDMPQDDLFEYVDDHMTYEDMAKFMGDYYDCELGAACEDIDDSESTKMGEYEDEDYPGRPFKLMLSYLGGAPLLWVLEGPVTISSVLCSPCVPGAVDLDYEEQKVEMGRLKYGDDAAVREFNHWLRERFGMRRGCENGYGYDGYDVPASWRQEPAQ
jgi:hypothetical protein